MGDTYFNSGSPDVTVVVELHLEGNTYELERFSTDFTQEVSNENLEPKSEVYGGKIIITMAQIPDDILLDWASSRWKKKSGEIAFTTKANGSIMNVSFEDAACVSMLQSCSVGVGSLVSLTISPRVITLNDYTLEQEWNK